MATLLDFKTAFKYDPETGDIIYEYCFFKSKIGKSATRNHQTGYKRVKLDGKDYGAHRVAWLLHYGEWPKQQIDHINGNRGDNRMCNLRDVSQTENQQNRKSHREKALRRAEI